MGRIRARHLGCLATVVVWVAVANGQGIRGQWDFDQADLRATVGVAMEYYDPANNGQSAAKTQFGTTASFGIAAIGGQIANVMKFPACQPTEGYILHTNAPGNGGGLYINQYTLVMDVLFPANSTGWRSIFQTSIQNSNDGDFFVDANNGVGISNVYQGNLSLNVWHRLAVAVDLTSSTMAKYIDGALVGTQILAEGVNGRWALFCSTQPPDWLLLFADENNDTNTGFVNSVQFRDYTMSASEIAFLGGPSAAGIPQSSPPTIAEWDFNGNLNATTASPVLVAAAAAPASSPSVQFVNRTIAGTSAQVASFTRGTYFKMTHGLRLDGAYLNRYTLILDVMFPDTATSGWAALWQTSTTNNNDGDWFIRSSGHAIGISGIYAGSVPDGTWNRLALVIDSSVGTLSSYVNGSRVQQITGVSANGRWSIGSDALIFADEDSENSAGYVNSVQLRPYAMSDGELSALGGASAAGIPLPTPPGSIVVLAPNGGESWQAGTTRLITWTAQNPSGTAAIDLYNGTTYVARLGDAVMSGGQFTWNISPSVGDSVNYRIRVSASAFPDVKDDSNTSFTVFGSVEPTPTITKLPMLQAPGHGDMTLIWETDISVGSQAVEWGINTVSENSTTNVTNAQIDAAHTVHTATFGPLLAETVYKYRVRSGQTYSPVYSFRTAPHRATPVRAVWFADEHNYSIFRTQVPNMVANHPDLVLAAGDLMNDGSSAAEWHEYWFKSLEVGNLAQTTPVLFARGNHDGEFPIAYTYSALPNNEAWYSFTYGNSRLIFLDSNLDTGSRPDQRAWLLAELASPEAQSAQFRIVCFHKPPFTDLWDSAAYNGEAWIRADWVPLFEQYNVDVVICGHTHAYLRGQRNDVTYSIVGGAGNTLDTFSSFNWGFFVKTASVYHYVIMDIDRNKMTWLASNINGSMLDYFELTSQTPLVAPDFDADNDVDADDVQQLVACVSGPGQQRSAACAAKDLDGDGDVDQIDFGILQRCYSGPGRHVDLNCQ